MKINHKKQRGATLITWLIVAGIGILLASAVVKVAPYYVEFNSVKGMMKRIAAEPGVKKANMRQIKSKIEKYLDINNFRALEYAYYNSRKGTVNNKTKNPFSLKKMRKGKNRKMLTVSYDVPEPWIGNLNFLIRFKHSVVLGEPDTVIKINPEDLKVRRETSKLNLN